MAIVLSSFLLLFVTIFISLIFSKIIKKSKHNLPPGPKKLPIIGNLHQFHGLLHRCLHDLSKKHGPVMHLRLGFVPMVLISSSEGAEEALKTHDLECCSRPSTMAARVFSRNGKDIGLGVYGDVWRELRKLAVREFFSLKKVGFFMYVREEESELMVKKLRESALKQSPVDLTKTLFFLSASIIFRTAFGQSFLENKHIDKDRIKDIIFEAHKNLNLKLSDLFSGPGWLIDLVSGQHQMLYNAFTEVDTFLNHIIDDHRLQSPTKDRPDMIYSILDMIHKQDHVESFNLTIDHLKGIIQDIYLAGIDTSASTIIWAMAELVRNPRVMKKVQDEIQTCIGYKSEERIVEEDLNKLQYLKLVVKETLRLHPPAPLLLPRETMSQIKIQGYDIPPKTLLLVNAWSIGRDPQYWKNPEEFNPDRFMDCNVDYKGQNFELLPFGSGRRICPGMASAIATVELGLLNLLYFFDWRMLDEEKDIDMEETGNVTIVKKTPLELLPVLRC